MGAAITQAEARWGPATASRELRAPARGVAKRPFEFPIRVWGLTVNIGADAAMVTSPEAASRIGILPVLCKPVLEHWAAPWLFQHSEPVSRGVHYPDWLDHKGRRHGQVWERFL